MKRKTSGWAVLLLCLLALQLLTACAQATAQVTVKRNGGLELAASLRVDSKTAALAGSAVDKLEDKLAAAGIALQQTRNGDTVEYRFAKSYASVRDLQLGSGIEGLNIADTDVQQERRWLYTKYVVAVTPKLDAYAGMLEKAAGQWSDNPLAKLLVRTLAFDFKLTLPLDLYGPNNADSQSGNTLTWHIALADPQPIELSVYVPNVRNIAIAAAVTVAVLAAVIIWFVRSRRRRRRTPE